MTELKTPKLTEEERAHIEKGGRVLIVEEIPGPLWRVLVVSQDGCKVLLKPAYPKPLDGYSDYDWAVENAQSYAALATDNPIVRS
jgi:hypothetical protein